ncbi:MAG: DUF4112 domain-containing protein [Gemmatimonadota bacterium]
MNDIRWVRTLARVLDRAIRVPGTDFRIGLDGLLGLLPGLGDAAGMALSTAIVLAAVRAGAPRGVLSRMLANVALDAALGAVPLLGDAFDFAWKANARNALLLERFLEDPAPVKGASRGFTAVVIAALTALSGLAVWAGYIVLRTLLGG